MLRGMIVLVIVLVSPIVYIFRVRKTNRFVRLTNALRDKPTNAAVSEYIQVLDSVNLPDSDGFWAMLREALAIVERSQETIDPEHRAAFRNCLIRHGAKWARQG